MANWTVKNKYGDFQKISEVFRINPITARLIVNRDICRYEDIRLYLKGNLKDLHSPYELKGMNDAVDTIISAIVMKKKIRIIGDYDIDGVMSSYILFRGLKEIGGNVSVEIPDRISDGYGINERLVDDCLRDEIGLIVTVDNGIAAAESIQKARDNGIEVVITDHHRVQDVIPPANAIIDPHQVGDNSRFKDICGGFIAFKLVQALYAFQDVDKREETALVPYAAIATIGDIMPLVDENRILVKEGLKMIPHADSIGLRTLLEMQGLKDQEITCYHVGFVIGPCINASGRLDSAHKALELFQTKDPVRAKQLASDLVGLNSWRKEMTINWTEKAIEGLESQAEIPKVIVCYLADCHESIAGIVAGRLKDYFMHPTFVLTNTENGIKGSGRSIEGYDMFANMQMTSDLFEKFGGHSMAAGLTLKAGKLEEFDKKINDICALKEEDFTKRIRLDMQLPFKYVNERLIMDIRKMSPFGTDNQRPLFGESDVFVRESVPLGANNNAIRLILEKDGISMRGICFGDADAIQKRIDEKSGRITIAFYPEINEYRDRRYIQLVITDFK